jgi:hypothetical protein
MTSSAIDRSKVVYVLLAIIAIYAVLRSFAIVLIAGAALIWLTMEGARLIGRRPQIRVQG